VDASADQVRHALLGVVHAGGWSVKDERPGELHLVEYRTPSIAQTTWKAKIRVKWQPGPGSCDVLFEGHIAGFGPIQARHLRGRLGALRAAFEHELSAATNTGHQTPATAPPGTPAARFDPYTGEPLTPRFDSQTGEPLTRPPTTDPPA
jgi:hypothetical protein